MRGRKGAVPPHMDIGSNRLSYTYFDESKKSKKFKKLLEDKKLNKVVQQEMERTTLSLDSTLLSGLQMTLDYKASDTYAEHKRGVDLLRLKADWYEVKMAETIERSYEAIQSEIKAGAADHRRQQQPTNMSSTPLSSIASSSSSMKSNNNTAAAGRSSASYLDEVDSVTTHYDIFREKDYFFRNVRASTLQYKLTGENVRDTQGDAITNSPPPSPNHVSSALSTLPDSGSKTNSGTSPVAAGGSYKPTSWSDYSIIDAKTSLLELNSKSFVALNSSSLESQYLTGEFGLEFGLGLELGLDSTSAASGGTGGSWFWSNNGNINGNNNEEDDNNNSCVDNEGEDTDGGCAISRSRGDRIDSILPDNYRSNTYMNNSTNFSALWTDTLLFSNQIDIKAERDAVLSEAEQEHKKRLKREEENEAQERARIAAQFAAEKDKERLKQAALSSSSSYADRALGRGGSAGDMDSNETDDASIDALPTLSKHLNLTALSFVGGQGVDNESDLKPYAVISHFYISCCSLMRGAIDECYYSFVKDPLSYGVDTLRVGHSKLALLRNTFTYSVDNNSKAKKCYKEFQKFISMQRLYYANEVTDRLKQITEVQVEYSQMYNSAADEFEAYQKKHHTIELETAKHITTSDKMDAIKKDADTAIAKLGRELKNIQEKEAFAVMKFKEWDHIITEIIKKWRKKYLSNIENLKLMIKRIEGILRETATRIIQKTARQKFLIYYRKEIFEEWNDVYESRRQRVERLVERKQIALKAAYDWASKKTPVTTAIQLPKLNFRKGLK